MESFAGVGNPFSLRALEARERVVDVGSGAGFFAEIRRVLRPGGWLQFADIANGRPVAPEAVRDIDLWAACIAGGLPRVGWQKVLEDAGFTDVTVGPAVDVFGGAQAFGVANPRLFRFGDAKALGGDGSQGIRTTRPNAWRLSR